MLHNAITCKRKFFIGLSAFAEALKNKINIWMEIYLTLFPSHFCVTTIQHRSYHVLPNWDVYQIKVRFVNIFLCAGGQYEKWHVTLFISLCLEIGLNSCDPPRIPMDKLLLLTKPGAITPKMHITSVHYETKKCVS